MQGDLFMTCAKTLGNTNNQQAEQGKFKDLLTQKPNSQVKIPVQEKANLKMGKGKHQKLNGVKNKIK